MSKGKDFRPRRRGFDDDEGPMPFESRGPRPPRAPFGGGFGGPAPDPMAGGAPVAPVDATVKWFKADKGFGFVELANGQGDAFLHINALQSAGYESVPPGSKMKVQISQGQKGAQVAHEAIRPTSAERTPEKMARYLDDDALKLYRLIWQRFVASQMTQAVFDQTDRKSTRLNSSHVALSRMPSSA